jgi:NADH:ubiquinone oxidoreductase subunit H
MLLIAMFMMAIRASTPRITMKQMLNFSWKYLVPLSLLNVAWIMFAKIFIYGASL